ncbi:cysteinyl leukotriene receptor 2-like [Ylistrum balloti]|uniref:cysteinyl leukotriene receptor 2-like n=1 Tax=Ylistrum balloti TaxID=509963 RepID=UPI002905F43C|nr:cysteinyl leukotriene receptor 2-like [Ylistrum balloti]
MDMTPDNHSITYVDYEHYMDHPLWDNFSQESDSFMPMDNKGLYETASTLRNVFLPIIVIVGLTGNTVTMVVFMSTHMKKSSATAFLATLAFVDNVFLIALFTTWFDGSISNIIRTESLCQLLVYVTYVTSFLSIWYVVGFTAERYIAICHPFRSPIVCSRFREKIYVIFLAVMGGVLYNYALWTTSVVELNGVYRCGHKFQYINLLEKVTWIDTIITMIIPFLLILLMNIKVVCKAAAFHRKRKHCLKPNDSFNSSFSRSKSRALRNKPQMRVTRTLVLVSTTFLVLNLPSHVRRLYTLIIYTTTQQQTDITMIHYLLQEITQLLYYSTFSVNFFLYALYGKHFQSSLILMIKSIKYRICCRKSQLRLERTSSAKGVLLSASNSKVVSIELKRDIRLSISNGK